MDKDIVTQKRSAIERRYNELQEQKNTIIEEMNRLQGEYRAYGDMLNISITAEKTLKKEDKNRANKSTDTIK